jgi:hypothetical protein
MCFPRRPKKQAENNGRAIMTADKVKKMRKDYVAGLKTQAQLRHQYGIKDPTVKKILTRKLWAHI